MTLYCWQNLSLNFFADNDRITWVQYLITLFISQEQMKERMAHSPNAQQVNSHLDINFKKSPHKFMMYDSPQAPPQLPTQEPQNSYQPTNSFHNVKKLSDEPSSLRQTMSSKFSSRITKKNSLYDFQYQDQKPNKLNDFLRQTMSYRSTKAFSQKLASQLTNSNEVTLRKDDIFNTYKSYKNQDTYRRVDNKQSGNLLQGQRSLDECQLINQKIKKNKKLIQQLKKGPRQREDYLKNLNTNRSPTYIDLDREKQLDDKGFRKIKKQESGHFMTPKLNKGSYDNRFNSSTFIDKSNPTQSFHEPQVTSLTEISPVKRNTSVPNTSSPTDDYEIGKKLGEGKFGCVNLARHKKTSGLFALKKIPKAMIKSHMMIDQLALQIRLQSSLQHRNILGMYGFFDDKTHLYIVLEYMDGGTLYQILKKGKLSQKDAATVIRQVTEAIDCLHDLGIAHRDLKPENIVISNEIYKLCDFGWAAMCNERRKTYCGTFDYVAPQILEGVQYDMTVDLWCLGVMTFELMTGKAPFYHISRKQTMKRIKNVETQTIQFPEGMSEIAKDFIDKLIRKNPLERMKASQALLHPFIKDIDFVN